MIASLEEPENHYPEPGTLLLINKLRRAVSYSINCFLVFTLKVKTHKFFRKPKFLASRPIESLVSYPYKFSESEQ